MLFTQLSGFGFQGRDDRKSVSRELSCVSFASKSKDKPATARKVEWTVLFSRKLERKCERRISLVRF
jgi:hypothetical protein